MANEKPVAELPVVAWQERQQKSHGEWTAWYDAGAPTSMGKGPGLSEVFGGIEYQWRPLTPLADAQALQEQVRALEADAQRSLEERIAMAIDQADMQEQLEAERADAERYRWLRAAWLADIDAGEDVAWVAIMHSCDETEMDADIDAAIDASRGTTTIKQSLNVQALQPERGEG